MVSDEYRTIIGISESRLVVKKSRFISLATSVNSPEAAKPFLDAAREKYPSATHYCYAYSIGLETDKREYAADAGEPTHSAGHPILTAINSSGLSNLICVVARYYGGVNLGIGGLIRAYGGVARDCLANAKIETRIFHERLQLQAPYDKIGAVLNLCNRLGGKILNVQYDQYANASLQVRRREVENFKESLQGIDSNIKVTYPENIYL
jgi:uncharacterized YigZ family protein